MKIGSAFPSTFLKAADLQGRRVTVQIDRVTIEDLGDGEKKPVLHFIGKDRGLVLNKTNAARIEEFTGTDETDEWHGASIVLFVDRVDFQGKRVDAIRVDRAPQAAPKPKPTPVVDDFDAEEPPF